MATKKHKTASIMPKGRKGVGMHLKGGKKVVRMYKNGILATQRSVKGGNPTYPLPPPVVHVRHKNDAMISAKKHLAWN